MSDLAKCKGTDCPLKDNCYRYTSKCSFWQSWLGVVPFDEYKHRCEYYSCNSKWNKDGQKQME